MRLSLKAVVRKAKDSYMSRDEAISKFCKIFKQNPDMLLEFNVPGTFNSVNAAEKAAKENGYRVGRMCYNEPIGLAYPEEYEYIAKWQNISCEDYPKLRGVLLFKDGREGNVWMAIK